MSESTILASLQGGLIAAVEASIDPDFPTKYIGIGFNIPDNGRYLEVVTIPNNRIGDFWGDEKNHQGIFRLVLHWQNNGAGPYDALEFLESVGGYFHVGRRLQNVLISAKPDLTGVIEAGAELLYPASIRYQSFSA